MRVEEAMDGKGFVAGVGVGVSVVKGGVAGRQDAASM